jgi:hypothetical protein
MTEDYQPLPNEVITALQAPRRRSDIFPFLGVLMRRVQRVPARNWLFTFAAIGGATGLFLLVSLVFQDGETKISRPVGGENMLASQINPETLAGVTEATSGTEYIDRMYSIIPEYEKTTSRLMAEDITALTTIEANRLNSEALKEVQEGRFDPIDPMNLIDLNECKSKTALQKCVLLRFAGDGIKQYNDGIYSRDLYKAAAGAARFRAAMMALYPPGEKLPASSLSLQAMANDRRIAYSIIQRLPSSEPFAQKLAIPDQTQSGLQQIKDNNPTPGTSAQ